MVSMVKNLSILDFAMECELKTHFLILNKKEWEGSRWDLALKLKSWSSELHK
jgi:hypothetical protein